MIETEHGEWREIKAPNGLSYLVITDRFGESRVSSIEMKYTGDMVLRYVGRGHTHTAADAVALEHASKRNMWGTVKDTLSGESYCIECENDRGHYEGCPIGQTVNY